MKSTTAERIVNVPVDIAYSQWMQFESFPRFMEGIEEVRQIDDRRFHWKARMGGISREWEAAITDQVPNRRIAWAGTDGFLNQGAVSFEPVGPDKTKIVLDLSYQTEGITEKIADFVGLIDGIADTDMERFKDYIEELSAAR